jgi:hypothetical protein
VAVDIERAVLAGGGVMHADCEQVLLDLGNRQHDVWGGDWIPESATVRFTSLINVRPTQGNRSIEVSDQRIRESMEQIIRRLCMGT